MQDFRHDDQIEVRPSLWILFVVCFCLGTATIILDVIGLTSVCDSHVVSIGQWTKYPVGLLLGLAIAISSIPAMKVAANDDGTPTGKVNIRISTRLSTAFFFFLGITTLTIMLDIMRLTGVMTEYTMGRGVWIKYLLSLLASFMHAAKRRL